MARSTIANFFAFSRNLGLHLKFALIILIVLSVPDILICFLRSNPVKNRRISVRRTAPRDRHMHPFLSTILNASFALHKRFESIFIIVCTFSFCKTQRTYVEIVLARRKGVPAARFVSRIGALRRLSVHFPMFLR